MHDQPKYPLQSRTVIGTFVETWDAESALEDLNFAGFEGHTRYVKQDDKPLTTDDSKAQGGFKDYFARVHGFENPSEYDDSAGNFTVNPDAEEYFSEAFSKSLHILLVQAGEKIDKAIDIINLHHGKVEIKHWSFFNSMAIDEHLTPGETFEQPPRLHPTQAIITPRDANT